MLKGFGSDFLFSDGGCGATNLCRTRFKQGLFTFIKRCACCFNIVTEQNRFALDGMIAVGDEGVFNIAAPVPGAPDVVLILGFTLLDKHIGVAGQAEKIGTACGNQLGLIISSLAEFAFGLRHAGYTVELHIGKILFDAFCARLAEKFAEITLVQEFEAAYRLADFAAVNKRRSKSEVKPLIAAGAAFQAVATAEAGLGYALNLIFTIGAKAGALLRDFLAGRATGGEEQTKNVEKQLAFYQYSVLPLKTVLTSPVTVTPSSV